MTDINTTTEKQIVNYLDKNGPSMLGELVKELKLSYTNGLQTIKKLQDKGIIKQSSAKVHFALHSK
jgi:DNA-binding Lrp family transcriptional regulator